MKKITMLLTLVLTVLSSTSCSYFKIPKGDGREKAGNLCTYTAKGEFIGCEPIRQQKNFIIKDFGNGNRILIEILNGKLKGEKGYINLKGFKEISDKILEKYIGTTWRALATHESIWIDPELKNIDMSKYSWEYGIVLFSTKYLKNDNFENRFLNSLNLILIKEKIELNDEITQYDCERDSSKIFLYNFNDDIYGLLQESGIPKDYVFCKGYFWNE